MANDLTRNEGNVWVIDTASATNIATDKVRIELVRWVVTAAGVATDNVQIANGEGDVVWESVNDLGSAQFQHESGAPLYLHGLRVPVLDRGILYLYLDLNRS